MSNLVKVKVKVLSHVPLFVTPWIVVHQAPLSMEFSRQGYWNGLPFPFPGDLPNPGIESRSPTLRVGSLPSEPPRNPNILKRRKQSVHIKCNKNFIKPISNNRKTFKRQIIIKKIIIIIKRQIICFSYKKNLSTQKDLYIKDIYLRHPRSMRS